MIINDRNGLLKVNSMMDELLEELDQNAAGPELEKAAELDNEATLEKAPRELTPKMDNKDIYGDDEDFAEDVGEVVVENIEDIAYLLESYGAPLLEGIDYEDLEIMSQLLEAPFVAGQGAKQQQIQANAQAQVDKAKLSAQKAADTHTQNANKAWNFGKGFGNLMGRIGATLTGNKEKLDKLAKDREDGKKLRQQHLNRAQGALKGYETRSANINAQRKAAQEKQNKASVSSTMSQAVRKGKVAKGTAEYDAMKAEVAGRKNTGADVSGGAIKKRNWFQRTFSKNKSFYESLENMLTLSNNDWFDILEENGFESSIENLMVINEQLDFLCESEQLAAGPELERAAELDNEATLEKAPRELTPAVTNKDMYGDDEDFAEDVGEVVVEANAIKLINNALASQQAYHTAEANRLEKRENEARKAEGKTKDAAEKAAAEKKTNDLETRRDNHNKAASNLDFDKVTKVDTDKDGNISKTQHHWWPRLWGGNARTGVRTAADTFEVQNGRKAPRLTESVSDLELMEILQENGYEASLDNLIIFKEGIESGKYVIYEEELETEVMPAEAEEKGVADDEPAERGEEKEDESKEDSEEKKDEEKEETVNEGLDGIFALINQINESLAQTAAGPELDSAKELDNEATVESDGKELTSDIDSKDVFPADEHEQKEDVGEVVVEKLEPGAAKEIGRDYAGMKKDPKFVNFLKKNRVVDRYEGEDDENAAKRQKEIMRDYSDSLRESDQNAAGPELEAGKELKNEATKKEAEKELKSDKDNKDVFPADEHEQKEDVGEVVVKESEQLAAGPELDSAKELDNEATEEKAPKTAPASTDNKDVYCDGCHKQVEDVVEVVVEAVSACKAKGKPATKENIAEEAKELFEMANFDIDAFIMSREMNGSKKFDEYEKLEGKGAECALTGLRESVKYNSLKEACMMDEGYFAEDSYVKETASEKVAKLTEQVSLLMAREANDPLYDELLKESAYCMRLREQLQNKYKRAASTKVAVITKE